MQIEIVVEAKLSNGTRLALTDEQQRKLDKAAYELLFGEKPRKKNVLPKRIWSPEEDEEIKSRFLINGPKGRELSQALAEVAAKLNRTPAAISARMYSLKG